MLETAEESNRNGVSAPDNTEELNEGKIPVYMRIPGNQWRDNVGVPDLDVVKRFVKRLVPTGTAARLYTFSSTDANGGGCCSVFYDTIRWCYW